MVGAGMSEKTTVYRSNPRAPRRIVRRPVLVRVAGTLRCWAARLVDWSLSGAKLAGLPPRGGLDEGTTVEILEGLDADALEKLAPLLSASNLQKFEQTAQRLQRQLGLRRSTGRVVRIESKQQRFAVEFDDMSDDGRAYPFAQARNPSLRANFTYKDRIGVLSVKGKFTPGAAIDLAKDVVHDVAQCLVIVDLSSVIEMNRTAVEKFRTRLSSELNEQDLTYALSVVCPEQWVCDVLGQVRTYPSLSEAREAFQSSLAGSISETPTEGLIERTTGETADEATDEGTEETAGESEEEPSKDQPSESSTAKEAE